MQAIILLGACRSERWFRQKIKRFCVIYSKDLIPDELVGCFCSLKPENIFSMILLSFEQLNEMRIHLVR